MYVQDQYVKNFGYEPKIVDVTNNDYESEKEGQCFIVDLDEDAKLKIESISGKIDFVKFRRGPNPYGIKRIISDPLNEVMSDIQIWY